MQGKLTYHNKWGQLINLSISRHARQMFLIRWPRMFPDKPLSEDSVDDVIATWFSHTSRLKKTAHLERKYGKDTLYFRTNAFTFVVRGPIIVTILISDRGKRYLNNPTPLPPPPIWEPPPSLKPQHPSFPLKKKKRKIIFIPMIHYEE